MTSDSGTLDVDTCLRLLDEHHVGRLAFSDDDGPMIVPTR